MRLKLIIFSVVMLLLSNHNGYSQSVWTLEQCIQYALDNNIRIKQQNVVIEQNENTLEQSKYALIPSASANTNYNMGWGRTLDQTNYQFVDGERTGAGNGSLNASTTIFNGLRKQHTIKKNAIDLKSSIQDVEKLKNDISLNVAAAYLQVLLANENLAITKQQLESTIEQVERTKKLVDAGKLTLSNLLELESQQAGEESKIVSAENDLAMAYLNLKQLLELNTEEAITVNVPNNLNVPLNLTKGETETLFNDAILRLPEIKSAELKIESAHKSLLLARANYYPTLNASASYGSSYSDTRKFPVKNEIPGTNETFITYKNYPFNDQIKDNTSSSIGLSLSVPIFNGLQTRIQVKNAKLGIRNYELELQRTKNDLYKTIQQAQVDVSAAFNSYHATQKNVTAIEKSFEYTQKKFDVGNVTATDYTVAKNNLLKAQSDNVQAKYQYIFKTKILDFYKGLPITL